MARRMTDASGCATMNHTDDERSALDIRPEFWRRLMEVEQLLRQAGNPDPEQSPSCKAEKRLRRERPKEGPWPLARSERIAKHPRGRQCLGAAVRSQDAVDVRQVVRAVASVMPESPGYLAIGAAFGHQSEDPSTCRRVSLLPAECTFIWRAWRSPTAARTRVRTRMSRSVNFGPVLRESKSRWSSASCVANCTRIFVNPAHSCGELAHDRVATEGSAAGHVDSTGCWCPRSVGDGCTMSPRSRPRRSF